MKNQTVLTLTFGKSGTFLINRIIEEIQKQNLAFNNFYRRSGINQLIKCFCKDYIHGDFMHEWQQIEYVKNCFQMVIPHPQHQFFNLDINFLLKNTSLITSHTNPSIFMNDNSYNFDSIKKIYVYRDIRDVIVSWMYFTIKPELLLRWPEYKHKNIDSLLSDYDLIAKQVEKWVEHLNSGLSFEDKILIIKFENLVKKKSVYVEKINNYLGTSSDIQRILNDTSRETMRKESESHIRDAKTKKRWQDIFNTRHKNIIKDIAGKLLIQQGYTKDNNW